MIVASFVLAGNGVEALRERERERRKEREGERRRERERDREREREGERRREKEREGERERELCYDLSTTKGLGCGLRTPTHARARTADYRTQKNLGITRLRLENVRLEVWVSAAEI